MCEMGNIKYLSDEEAKGAIIDIGKRMYDKGFVASNDGNISVKVAAHEIWVTPTGVSKGYMSEDMLVKLDLKGNILEGVLLPSSEIKMHLMVYSQSAEVMAVTHAHPPVATSFAISGIELDSAVLPEAVVNLGVVHIAPYATPGTQQVPESIKPFCRDFNAVLLANHGALTWGRDIYEAYYRLESLEHYANILMYSSRVLGNVNILSCEQVWELIKIRKSLGIKAGGVSKGK